MEQGYRLWGTPGSLYTGKARAYLRQQRIDFAECAAGEPRFRAEIVPRVGRWIIPVLETPDGALVQDGADIIDHFERRGGVRSSAHPESGLLHTVSQVFELFGGEGLLRPAMHYRWNFDDVNLAFLRADFLAGLAPGAAPEEGTKVFGLASARMRRATLSFGVSPETIPLIERSYLQFLELFDAHLAHAPYLLGGRPTIGDYGLIAPLFAHLGRDPHPATLMKQRAPRVWRWVERMNAANADTPEYPGRGEELFAIDALPETLTGLLRFVAEDYLPEIAAHVAFANAWLDERPDLADDTNGLADPGARGIGRVAFPWRGTTIEVGVMPYRFHLLQRVQDAAEGTSAAERAQLQSLLTEAGLAALLTMKTRRRVRRRDHLEVWGPVIS